MNRNLKLLSVLLTFLIVTSFKSNKLKCHVIESMISDEYFKENVNYKQNLKDSFYIVDTGRYLDRYCPLFIEGRNVVLLTKYFKTNNKNYIYLTRCHSNNDSLIVSFFYPYQNIGISGFFAHAEKKLLKIKVVEF